MGAMMNVVYRRKMIIENGHSKKASVLEAFFFMSGVLRPIGRLYEC
jgi:hypothetical protein